MTVVPWQSGHSATWDMTIVHILAVSYVSQSSIQAGSAAAAASERKTAKYTSLSPRYLFFRWLWRLLAQWWKRDTDSCGTSAEEPHLVLPIHEKPLFSIGGFLLQFSDLNRFA